MSEMVEKVAKAIHDAFEVSEWNRLWPQVQDKYRAEARAAIAALREPTEAMMAVGRDAGNAAWDFGGMDDDFFETTWKAAIDEALNPTCPQISGGAGVPGGRP